MVLEHQEVWGINHLTRKSVAVRKNHGHFVEEVYYFLNYPRKG